MKKNVLYTAFLLLACQACGPSAQKDGKPLLMVSVPPQEEIVEAIAGEDFDVRTMLAHGANPETFDPSTSERLSVEQADVFFTTGVLPFEEMLRNSAISTTFVDTSEGVNLLYGTHGHCHHDGSGHNSEAPDPHYWSSVDGARQIARNISNSLKVMYPDKAGIFDSNLKKYERHLDSLNMVFTSATANAQVKSFAVWHPSLSYFARDYGLEQIAIGMDGKEMSAKSIREAIDHAQKENVKVFFLQKEYDSRQARTINDGIGSRLVEINPLEKEWEQQLELICDELSRP